jgi:hypothetical protein
MRESTAVNELTKDEFPTANELLVHYSHSFAVGASAVIVVRTHT